MPTLKRGYGAVRNLRCKSGARFPPSTVCAYMRTEILTYIPTYEPTYTHTCIHAYMHTRNKQLHIYMSYISYFTRESACIGDQCIRFNVDP